MERERECQIRYVSDSFVAGTSALSPGVPRHIYVEIEIVPEFVI